MHERSLVRGLLRQVDAISRAHDAEHVVAVNVSVGEFSGIEPELLLSAFDDMTISTNLAGAELRLDRVPLECCCRDCRAVTEIKKFRFVCCECQGRNLDILRGEELTIESVTLAGEEP